MSKPAPKYVLQLPPTAQERGKEWADAHPEVIAYLGDLPDAPDKFAWEPDVKAPKWPPSAEPPPERVYGEYQPDKLHLSYALVWELTGAPEIFRRLLTEFARGERLGVA